MQGTQMSRSCCWNVDWDRWKGTYRGEGRPCCIIPVHSAAVSFIIVCWQTSDKNSGSCALLCLAAVIIFLERTSLLIKLHLLSRAVLLAVLFGLPVCDENSVSLLTCERYIILMMIFLFLKKIMFVFIEAVTGTKIQKQKNEIQWYVSVSVLYTFWHMSFPFYSFGHKNKSCVFCFLKWPTKAFQMDAFHIYSIWQHSIDWAFSWHTSLILLLPVLVPFVCWMSAFLLFYLQHFMRPSKPVLI